MSKTERKLSAVSLILIAVMIFTAIFNLAYVGNVASAAGGNVASSSVGNRFEKSDLNFDSIREQYLNHNLVQNNTASYDGDRWVIVALEGATLYDKFKSSARYSDFAAYSASVEGQKAQKSLQIAQSEFLSKLDKHGINYEYKYSYTAINNAVAVKVNADAYNAIRKMNGVEDVYYVEYYDIPKVAVAVENDANVYTTGIYNSDGLGYKGEGMVVAILDTGLDRTHEAFQAAPTNPAWDKEYVQNVVASGKLKAEGTADDFYYSSKVPFAYDYADDDANVFPSYSSHGTHVAGIVAGKSDYVVNQETDETFVGVAPEAQLMICKVFTDDFDSEALGGANTMSILAALNDCTQLGVDVINMSLGSSAGFADEKSDDYLNGIYEAIEEEGISLVVAASNDYSSGFGGGYGTNLASNPDSGTVGSPSTYHSALSVASINGLKSSYIMATKTNAENLDDAPVAFVTNSSNEYGQEFKFIEQLYEIANENRKKNGQELAKKGDDLKFKFVVVGGVGAGGNYSSSIKRQLAQKSGYDGTIALVKRGTNTFAEKVQAAMTTDADAIIIYNNVAGTIRMSLGEITKPIPACSISMDAGKAFVELAGRSSVGTIIVNSTFEAGPFMSDFSSWGPTPDLQLKPEITAHGGEILSAVAGGYDRYSGTSMASPNMAGAVALLRQHLKATTDLTGKELNARVNQVLMSTATIANNDENNPYSPRKQGAGLAGIKNAIDTQSYITVISDGKVKGENKGDIRNKTKIELYDDPDKTGEYVLDFIINNITDKPLTYVPTTYVMTESMSSDNKTVSEKAYMLTNMSEISYMVGEDANHLGALNGDIVVDAGGTLAVRVTIKLNAQAKKYLDTNFVNGMYVEGFVSLAPKQGDANTTVTVGLPYLAFYGDWTDAPMFDYDEFEIFDYKKEHPELEESQLIKASAAATVPVGMYYEDKYIMPLGSYIYSQDETDVAIAPSKDKISISMFDDRSGHSIYELYMLYAGLLRGAGYMDVIITDDATGEVIYEDKLENVRKSYAGGGGNRGAPIMIELNPGEWGLQNNSKYSVFVKGQLDYEGGENPANSTYEFPFTVDFEDPEMLSYRIRYTSYTENKETKYRIYMDIDVRDNQYVQTVLPCYIKEVPDGLGGTESALTLVTKYPIAVNGQKGETSTVSFEITDIYEEYVLGGKLYVQIEDYALNAQNYRILPGQIQGSDAMNDPEFVNFVEDEYLSRSNIVSYDKLGTPYYNYNLRIGANTLYKFKTEGDLDSTVLKSLTWLNTDSKVQAQGGELFTGLAGRKTITLTNTTTDEDTRKTYAVINVTIGGTPGEEPVLTGIKMDAALNGSGVAVSINSANELAMNPNQTLKLTWSQLPWYCALPEVSWSSSNEKVATVDQEGNVTAIAKGEANIVITAVTKPGNPRVTKTVRISVGNNYRIVNYTLYDYYETGEIEIPSDLNIMYLDEDCFKGNTQITKVILPSTLTEIPEYAFMGCTALEEIVIPGQCIAIKERAFAGCTSLKKITLGAFVDSKHEEIVGPNGEKYTGTLTIGRRAFYGCTSLTDIENQDRLTSLYEGAFEDCTSLEKIDISELRVAQNSIFKDCTKLSTVTTTKDTALSRNMFEGCTSLVNFTFKASSVPSGIFSGCDKLANISFENAISSIGANAFADTAFTSIQLPNGNITLSADAFKNEKLTTIILSADTKLTFANNSAFSKCNAFKAYALDNNASNYYSVVDGVLYNKNMTQLVAVPFAKTEFTMPSEITSIASGALSGVNVTTIDLSMVENIGNYAFAGNTKLTTVKLPSGLTEIAEGMFDGCTALVSVTADDNFASVVKIGDKAFRNCGKLETLSMANVKAVGNSAFESSAIKVVPSLNIETIGDKAFKGSRLVDVTLEKLTKVGEGAFSNISTLVSAKLGPITDMGMDLFNNSHKLSKVSFAEGTTEISAFAFGSLDAKVQTQLTVTIPSTVEYIGQFAFYNQTGLKTVNLSHVLYVDAMAFCFTSIKDVDLSNIQQIGSGAFAYTLITNANLEKAQIVGSEAFYEVQALTQVTFGALEQIGKNAFFGTAITEVTLPASFDNRTHSYEWVTKDEKGNIEDTKSREELNYEPGAFTGAKKLTKIDMANGGNDVYFSKDGVLYSRVANGLVLEQYPAAKTGETYEVLDGTVIIQSEAFMASSNIKNVVLPYTVKVIGSNAFFNSSANNFTFNSVEAPALLTTAFDEYDVPSLLQEIFSRNQYGMTNFYANFCSFAILADSNLWVPEVYEQYGKFGLTMTIPLNSKGYTGVWEMFFENIKHTDSIMPEYDTNQAIEAINQLLPYVDKIATMSLDEVKSDGPIGKLAADARIAYNKITNAAQRQLIADKHKVLVDFEKALRDKKTELTGTRIKISRLVISKEQDKYRYVEGESFDPTGMELTAIYEDGSEVVLEGDNYTCNPTVLKLGDTEVTITYIDGDMSISTTVKVQVSAKQEPVDPNPPQPNDPSDPGDNNTGLSSGAKIGIGVGVSVGVLAVIAVVVAVLLISKKKKANDSDNGVEDSNEDEIVKSEEVATKEKFVEETETESIDENSAENVASQDNVAQEEVISAEVSQNDTNEIINEEQTEASAPQTGDSDNE